MGSSSSSLVAAEWRAGDTGERVSWSCRPATCLKFSSGEWEVDMPESGSPTGSSNVSTAQNIQGHITMVRSGQTLTIDEVEDQRRRKNLVILLAGIAGQSRSSAGDETIH